jgi:hypothetical protein
MRPYSSFGTAKFTVADNAFIRTWISIIPPSDNPVLSGVDDHPLHLSMVETRLVYSFVIRLTSDRNSTEYLIGGSFNAAEEYAPTGAIVSP